MAMFASPSQVPVNTSLAQISNILSNRLRHVSVRPSSSESRQSNGLERVVRSESQQCRQKDQTLPSCISLLNNFNVDPLTHEVSVKHGLPAHWRESHKSEDSFHKNILGTNTDFSRKLAEVTKAVFGDQFTHQLLSTNLRGGIILQQSRGFKTKRSGATGIGNHHSIGRIEPLKVPASSLTGSDAELYQQISSQDTDKKDRAMGISKVLQAAGTRDVSHSELENLNIAFSDGFNSAGELGKLAGGITRTRGDKLRILAFTEGYRCYNLANQPRTQDVKRKGWFAAILIGLALALAFKLVRSGTINVGKVQLLNGEQYEVNPETVNVTFDDVKGCDEAKEELKNVVDFLKNPNKYTALGAKLPNGCLLVGPPGVGKTLLAKAVAGEAGVPFFQASGAEFDEVFVGTGAKRVRQLFQAAKAKAPCVIFLDEIDSVGGKRTSSDMHPYANQTVNQLLTEMDGFEDNSGVIVLGATNARDNLDKALLRPGRFDVEVPIRVPDLKGRQEILNLYLPKLKLDTDVDVLTLAKQTIGCTGADLMNICNHAAMKAATDGAEMVNNGHMSFALDKVTMGPQKRRIADPTVNEGTAYHEAGHALMLYYSKVKSTTLHKITILPRGQSLGMTQFIREEKRESSENKQEMLDNIDVAMGGRVAEELKYGENGVTSGASSDMMSATRIAEAMVMRFGFSDKVGLRVHAPSANHPISDKMQEQIDSEVEKILQESYERSKKLIGSKQKELKYLAEALLEYEELTFEEAKTVIEGGKLTRSPVFDMKSLSVSDSNAKDSKPPSKTPTSYIKPAKL